MITQPYWRRISDSRENAIVMERPDVILELRKHPLGVERLIYAVFHWPRKQPTALPLRRELMLEGPRAWQQSKELVALEWHEEHERWGEPEVLREMLRKPSMTVTEIAALRAKTMRVRREAAERASKLIAERKEKRARAKAGAPS